MVNHPFGFIFLAAEGDTADREAEVPVVATRRDDVARVKVQVVGVGAIGANRGPVVAVVACVAQDAAWSGYAAPDKQQRRLHNSIRIS